MSDALTARIDQPATPGDWFEIAQERIDDFAAATLDPSESTSTRSEPRQVPSARPSPTAI